MLYFQSVRTGRTVMTNETLQSSEEEAGVTLNRPTRIFNVQLNVTMWIDPFKFRDAARHC